MFKKGVDLIFKPSYEIGVEKRKNEMEVKLIIAFLWMLAFHFQICVTGLEEKEQCVMLHKINPTKTHVVANSKSKPRSSLTLHSEN